MLEEAGYVEFVDARWSALYRLAYLLTASRSTAQELLERVLTRTYLSWPRVRGLADPDAYVRKVLVNAVVSQRRPEGWDSEPPGGPLEMPVDRIGSPMLDDELLWPLVCALPAPQRAVVVLRYYEHASDAEIATLLGCARGTVESHAAKAIGALRRGLASVGTRQPRRVG
ncbi:MAG TPA: SigE family RNA polymerase sigma factor [Nocardioidaceae bacterium]|nr:SigE family RNA polymerase sigma factor [Nocardioidaceae bacterium]